MLSPYLLIAAYQRWQGLQRLPVAAMPAHGCLCASFVCPGPALYPVGLFTEEKLVLSCGAQTRGVQSSSSSQRGRDAFSTLGPLHGPGGARA